MSAIQQMLTDHIDIWTAAETEKRSGRGRASSSAARVYGVRKLRGLILELAIRGKLVPQDASDEPASELLMRIRDRNTKKLADGKVKNSRPLSSLDKHDLAFAIPSGWSFTKFNEIFSLEYGENLPAEKRTNSGEYPVYGSNGVVGTHNVCFVQSPCIVVGRKGSAGALNLCLASGCCVTDVAYFCIPPEEMDLYFSFKLFQTLGLDILGKGIKPGLSRNDAYVLPIAIPPIAEQRRIVAKVDELMTLCDQLEAQHSDAANAHEQLVSHLLGTLTQSQSAADFNTNWQRIAEHFDTLFTTEASIDALKQTLMHLAVMGKLVAQNANDEPASELLKRIQAEKAKLIIEGKIKKDKPSAKIEEEEIRYAIPSTWEWVRMADLCRPISSGSTPPAEQFQYENGVPFLKVYNIRNQEIDFEYKKQFIDDSLNRTKLNRSILIPGDIVMNIVGPPLGKVAIIPNDYPQWNCNQAIVFFGLIQPINVEYILTYLKEGSFLQDIELIGTAGQDNISVSKSKNILVPVPPLAEQHRIVAKLNQLLSFCDRLNACVANSNQLQKKIADVLVEHAILA